MNNSFAEILDFVISAGRVQADDLDSAEAEAEFEARERGLSDDEVEAAGEWARAHFQIKAAASALGSKGGKSRSEAKKAASRANGRKGGRPRKQ